MKKFHLHRLFYSLLIGGVTLSDRCSTILNIPGYTSLMFFIFISISLSILCNASCSYFHHGLVYIRTVEIIVLSL